MEPRLRKITLIVLSVLIVIVISFGVTKAFMKPVEQGGNLTEIALSSCAKIKLTGTSSINLSNSYPMSRNKGLQTTPYSLTVTSYCDTYVGFNLYIATLSSNTLDASKIHYVLTDKGSKDAIVEGVLSTADNGVANFSDTEKTELNTGLKGTYGSIYKIHNANIALKGNKQYDLYLFVDESVTNETMGQTFKAGVAVKSYDREKDKTLAEYVIEQYAGVQGNNNIYHHDGTLENGINDGSYRYSGASEDVNNYVCFGTNESPCPSDNLYRIIGVFEEENHGRKNESLVKLIKADFASSLLLGKNGNYYNVIVNNVDCYGWFSSNGDNVWSLTPLNTINLNTNFINNLYTTWLSKIATVIWKVGGNTNDNLSDVTAKDAYQNEIINPVPGDESATGETTYEAKIGLMYVSDYGFAVKPDYWSRYLINYYVEDISEDLGIGNTNWLFINSPEWPITRTQDNVLNIYENGWINADYGPDGNLPVRPTFYLNSDVMYSSGDGTMNNPIILED